MNTAVSPALAARDHAVPQHARSLAAQLSILFDRDVEIVKRLNIAHHRLANANQQLADPTTLATLRLQDLHWQIHHAFCAYQDAAEQRRQLAVDVGEIAQQLTDALTAAGWTAQQARRTNVHQLADRAAPGWGISMIESGDFSRSLTNTPQVWALRAASQPHRDPWEFLRRFAEHNNRSDEEVWTQYRLSRDALARDPLGD
jgi:hypothetical protein